MKNIVVPVLTNGVERFAVTIVSDGLKNVGNNFYKETVDSGEPVVEIPGRNATGQVVQFSMENSNVDIIKEMMEMIMTQKGLELLGKAMQAGEAMLKAGMGMT